MYLVKRNLHFSIHHQNIPESQFANRKIYVNMKCAKVHNSEKLDVANYQLRNCHVTLQGESHENEMRSIYFYDFLCLPGL